MILAAEESTTTSWFAFRIDASPFGIFDTFPDEAGRDAHLKGEIAAELMSHDADLFEAPPRIHRADMLGAKAATPTGL